MKLPRGYGFPVFGMMIPGDDRTIYEDDLKTIKYQYDNTEKLQEAGWLVD